MKTDEAALKAELSQILSNQQTLFLLIFPLLLSMPLKIPLFTL